MEAIEAEKAGQELDDDQRLVLNRERVRVMAEEAKKERGWGKRVKGWLTGGLKEEEEARAQLVVPSEGEVLRMVGVRESDVLERMKGGEEERRDGSGVLEAVKEKEREVEREVEERKVGGDPWGRKGSPLGRSGGPLDRVAEEAVEKAKGKGGWMSWGKGG